MATKAEIEAAARALCKIEGHDPDGPVSHFDDGREKLWEGWKAEAEAALTAAERVRADTPPQMQAFMDEMASECRIAPLK